MAAENVHIFFIVSPYISVLSNDTIFGPNRFIQVGNSNQPKDQHITPPPPTSPNLPPPRLERTRPGFPRRRRIVDHSRRSTMNKQSVTARNPAGSQIACTPQAPLAIAPIQRPATEREDQRAVDQDRPTRR